MTVYCEQSGSTVILQTGALRLTLDAADGLHAVMLENAHTGHRLPLNGPELAVDLDAAEQRFWITGWKIHTGEPSALPSDDEEGFQAGYHLPDFRDDAWENQSAPHYSWWTARDRLLWARTQLLLPEAAFSPITLVLGGFGLYDYRHMRVFLNGELLGERHTTRFWEEPGRFTIPAGDPRLRPDQLNLIAIQVGGIVDRTARLDALDPHGSRHFPNADILAAPFEQYIVVGDDTRKAALAVADIQLSDNCARFRLPGDDITAVVEYRAGDGVLLRHTQLRNTTDAEVRVMRVRLGNYDTGLPVSEGQRGFPVYVNDEVFFGLAHPSGWVTGEDGRVRLQQFPGKRLEAGESFGCMEAVIGAAPTGEARRAFTEHLRARSRRVTHGHDRPYAIFENFGSWSLDREEGSWTKNREEYALHSIAAMETAQRETGLTFDLFSVDFWVDLLGDLERFHPERFPEGIHNIRKLLAGLGTAPGLWIDSSMSGWSIGGNPAVQGCFTHNPEYVPNYWCGPFFCRASEPIRTLYRTAFNRHIREQDVRHLKFDNFRACCYNSRHDHLPGLYSTEAIEESVMQTLREYSETCPDVFIFLYWGYRSPWWLLHGDVLFEPGLDIEAASPGGAPTLYVRDGVTVGLDQAQWWCHDLPALGKDSLGVWLSDWPWNSSIGSERWQEGFVMDLCRGSLLAQPWSDWDFLTPPERAQLADFITLLRAQPTCFANPRFILGNPWRNEPYGYCCGDGTRLFLALNNCTWDDALLSLDAVPAGYELYRWYPDPAKLEGDNAAIAMRPFAVVLLEAVPAGTVPSIDREFAVQPLPTGFAEPSRTLPLTVSESPDLPPLRLPAEDADVAVEATRTLQVTATLPDSASAGTFALTLELFDSARLLTRQNPGQFFAALAMRDGEPVAAQPVVRESGYPCGWQAWRVPAPAGPARNLTMTVTVAADEDVTIKTHGYFIPQG